jgi:hypothetical protein
VTDPDSRNVKTRGGYMQGYNAQAAVTASQIVIAAEISPNSRDFGLLGPVVKAALAELVAVGVTDTPGVLVADAGYWHQLQDIINNGIQILIPPDAGNRTSPARGGTAASTRSCAASLTPTREAISRALTNAREAIREKPW